MRNHEVTQRHLLLNEHGRLKEAGWSRSLLQEYRREDIKAKRWRIKEWDYYLILNNHYGVASQFPMTVISDCNPFLFLILRRAGSIPKPY